MESHKDSFVDPGAMHGFCPFRFAALPKLRLAASRSLRMTYRRGVRGGRMFARVHGVPPYEFVLTHQ